MNALLGNEVCSETIVIRSTDDWTRVVRSLRYDGDRYTTTDLAAYGSRLSHAEQDAGLFALRGASS